MVAPASPRPAWVKTASTITNASAPAATAVSLGWMRSAAGKIRPSAPATSDTIAKLFAEHRASYPAVDVEVRLESRYVDLIAEGVDVAWIEGE